MAVSVVSHAVGDDLNSGVSHTVAFDCGAVGSDGALYIAIRASNEVDISAVAYNGVAATYVGVQEAFEVWRLLAPPASTSYNVTWTVGSPGGRCNHAFISLSGVDQTTPEGSMVGQTSTASGSRSTGSITCPSGGAIIAFLLDTYSDANASGTGMLAQALAAGRVVAATALSSTGNPTWTTSNYAYEWIAMGLPINAASSGSYAITADTTTYSITGQSAGLLATRKITADQGSYSISGQDVTLTKTTSGAYTLIADQGSYLITGSNALADYSINADTSTYTITGYDVTLTYANVINSYNLTADTSTYSLSGRSANLIWSNAPPTKKGKSQISLSMKMGL